MRGSDDETTVVGGGGALDVGEATRAPSREESGIEGIRLKLDQLMDVIGAVDERSRSYVSWSRDVRFGRMLIAFCGVTRCGSMPMSRLLRGTRRARFARRRLRRRI